MIGCRNLIPLSFGECVISIFILGVFFFKSSHRVNLSVVTGKTIIPLLFVLLHYEFVSSSLFYCVVIV